MSSDIRMNAEIKELAMWRAIGLQMVSFPLDPQAGLKADWWSSLTGSEDYESTRKLLTRVDEGAYQGHVLRLHVDAQKTVWVIGPLATEDTIQDTITGVTSGMLTLGDFSAATEAFRELMHRWLVTDCPPLSRVGFAGHLFWPQEDRIASYRKLGDFLPMQPDPETSEFLYRLNRKQRSNHIDGELNCVRTWSAFRFETKVKVDDVTAQSHVEHGCSVQFDVNTPAETTEALPHGSLCAIFDELIGIAKGIAERGDEA